MCHHDYHKENDEHLVPGSSHPVEESPLLFAVFEIHLTQGHLFKMVNKMIKLITLIRIIIMIWEIHLAQGHLVEIIKGIKGIAMIITCTSPISSLEVI